MVPGMSNYRPFSPGRRRALRGGVALIAATALPAPAQTPWKLTANDAGAYRFLPGNPVFAGGAVAEPGFAFVHALLRAWMPLEAALALIERHLKSEGRPMAALAGLELRLPRQLSADEFGDFNKLYLTLLNARGVNVDGLNPISRTNVAPASAAPDEAQVHAFSYCVPMPGAARSFVMSGITEGGPGGIVAPGDTSADGMRHKLIQVVDSVSRRLEELGMGWADATHIDIYTANDFGVPLLRLLEPALGPGLRRGVRQHYGRPPVVGLELELEARGLAREIIVNS